MTPRNIPDDADLHLLSKADALIRRNHPGGVGLEAEEVPLLVEALDDLPELTDALDAAEDPDFNSTQINPGFVQAATAAADSPAGASPSEVAAAVQQAVERTRKEMLAEMLVEQERAIHEATERARAEARALQARAVQAAYAQGKEEAEINQWPALQEARNEALQDAAMRMSEHLITLDAFISQAIEGWLAKELPAIISSELDAMVGRLRQAAASHMRATLLPDLSEKLSSVLDEALRTSNNE